MFGFLKIKIEQMGEEVPLDFTCSACKEILVEPGLFDCGHSLCEICFYSLRQGVCPECRYPFTQFTLQIGLRNYLQSRYPVEYARRLKSGWNDWEIDLCVSNWKSSLPELLSLLDSKFPKTLSECADTVRGTNIQTLITGSTDSPMVVSSFGTADFTTMFNPVAVSVRKNGRFYIIVSTANHI